MSKGFEYMIPGHSDEWEEIDGYDHEDAALEAGKKYDEYDHTLVNDSIYVLVREIGSEDVRICCARAEPDIHYSAGECTHSIDCKQCHKDIRPQLLEGNLPFDDRFCSHDCYKAHIAQYRKDLGLDKAKA